MVAGILITTKMGYEVIERYSDLRLPGGRPLERFYGTKKFAAYVDESGLVDDVGMNDLAAYAMDFLGFNLRPFLAGVRGDVILVSAKDGESPHLSAAEARDLCLLLDNLLAHNEDDSDSDGDEGAVAPVWKRPSTYPALFPKKRGVGAAARAPSVVAGGMAAQELAPSAVAAGAEHKDAGGR
jgi:hypothetical protein